MYEDVTMAESKLCELSKVFSVDINMCKNRRYKGCIRTKKFY